MHVIRFDEVSFEYPHSGGRRPALSGVSFTIEPGEMLAVVGANGSGKSTLARLCNGLLWPTDGLVTVDGIDTRDVERQFTVRASVGVVFQRPDDQIVGTAVEDDVAFGPENLGLKRDVIRERVDSAIAAVGLEGLERREPHLLSGGQKQRLAIAGALAMRPHYLVLDEPTSMIDAGGAIEVGACIASVRASGRGVLLITHDLAEALGADRVLVLENGRAVYAGSVAGLLGMGDLLDRWGLEVPDLVALAVELAARGVRVPADASTPESLAAVL